MTEVRGQKAENIGQMTQGGSGGREEFPNMGILCNKMNVFTYGQNMIY